MKKIKGNKEKYQKKINKQKIKITGNRVGVTGNRDLQLLPHLNLLHISQPINGRDFLLRYQLNIN
jgi:hypothetical protein